MENNHPMLNKEELNHPQCNENHKSMNPNESPRRTVSEGEGELRFDNGVSSLLKNFEIREEENGPQPCGGYAYDHDSLPIIIAVHSIIVDDEKPQEIKSKSQEDDGKRRTSENVTVTTTSQSVGDTHSTSKYEHNLYQRPILPVSLEI
jgi:hypothetical protein